MDQQQRDRGALFRNTREKKGEHDPDYRGEIDVGGQPYWINAWLRTSKGGTKYMSLSIKAKDACKPQRTYTQRRDDLEDAPF